MTDVTPRHDASDAPAVADAAGPALPVFLVAWSIVVAGVFASVLGQWDVVFGPHGMFPMVSSARPPLWMAPSLPVAAGSDGLAQAIGWCGLAASVGSLWPRIRTAALWIAALCWWQLSVSSPIVLGMPPDLLVLHGTVVAAMLSSPVSRPWGRLLGLAVVAKLYIEAGLSKLVYPGSGGLQEWLFGGFPSSFFEVAPLPTALAPVWDRVMTPGLYTSGAAVVAVGQVVSGVAAFGPRAARVAAFLFLSAFQLVLLSAANFGALCWSSLVLGLVLLIEVPLPWRGPGWSVRSGGWGLVVGLWVAGQAVQVGIDLAGETGRSTVGHMVRGWRVAKRYSMFMQMPPERVVWEIELHPGEGSPSRDLWPEGQVPLDAPVGHLLGVHHPRLTFMRWFSSTVVGRQAVLGAVRTFDASRPGYVASDARDWAAWACRREGAEGAIVLRAEVLTLDGHDWHHEVLDRSGPVSCSALREAPRWWDGIEGLPGSYQ